MPTAVKPLLPKIDWSNPITRGLVFDAPLIEKGGSSPVDLVYKQKGSFTNTPVWGVSAGGSGLSFTGHDTDRVTFNTLAPQNNVHRISVEILFVADATPSDGDRLFHKGQSAGAGARYFQAGEWVNGQGLFVAGDWSGNQGAWRTPLPSTGVLHHYVVTYDDTSTSNDPIVYLDGQRQTVTEVVTPSGTRSADTSSLWIGNSYTGSFSWKGKIYYTRYWNRILTHREVLELKRNPYQIYQKHTLFHKPQGITVDSSSNSGVQAAVSSLSWNHTVGSGSNRYLAVGVIQRDGDLADITPSSITFNGAAMTSAVAREGAFHAGNFGASVWVLPAPDVGTHSISVTLPGTSDHAAGFALSLFGVDQSTTPDDTADGLTSTFGVDDPSLSFTTTADGAYLFECMYSGAINADVSLGSGQTLIAELGMNGGGDTGGASYKSVPTAGASTMGWDVTPTETDAWVAAGISLKPAGIFTEVTKTHTTDSLLQKEFTKTHTSDALLKKELTVSHSTDADLKGSVEKIHTTDALLEKSTTLSHTTDALLVKSAEISHSTDSLLKKSFELTHSTDALLANSFTISHTTDAYTVFRFDLTHTTDAFLEKQLFLNPSFEFRTGNDFDNWTETIAGSSTITAETTEIFDQATSAKLTIDGSNNVASLSNSSVSVNSSTQYLFSFRHKSPDNGRLEIRIGGSGKYLQNDGSWNAATNSFFVNSSSSWNEFSIPLTTENIQTNIRVVDIKRSTLGGSQANKTFYIDLVELYEGKYAYELSHTTDALLVRAETKTHTTDALLEKSATVSHTTDSLLEKSFLVVHTTDALLEKSATVSHSTDALLEKSFTKEHTTDAFLKKTFTIIHTTDAKLARTTALTHSTDAVLWTYVYYPKHKTKLSKKRKESVKLSKRSTKPKIVLK